MTPCALTCKYIHRQISQFGPKVSTRIPLAENDADSTSSGVEPMNRGFKIRLTRLHSIMTHANAGSFMGGV